MLQYGTVEGVKIVQNRRSGSTGVGILSSHGNGRAVAAEVKFAAAVCTPFAGMSSYR